MKARRLDAIRSVEEIHKAWTGVRGWGVGARERRREGVEARQSNGRLCISLYMSFLLSISQILVSLKRYPHPDIRKGYKHKKNP